MPFLPAEEFGSPIWFEQLPILLPNEIPNHPQLVVEHQTALPDFRTIVHQQVFNNNGLVAWLPGKIALCADVTLRRSIECDMGDILGRLSSSEVVIDTSVLVNENWETCALGIANATRPGLEEVTSGTVDLRLEVYDTPFGSAEFAIRLNPDGTQRLIASTEANSDIAILLNWTTLTEWLHTDTGLGHLMSNGAIEFNGPMFKLSYIEGHLTWPRPPKDHQQSERFKELMDIYSRLRLSPNYLKLMDQIDDVMSS